MAGGAPPTSLAALVHDTGGHLLSHIETAGSALAELFSGIALGITETTQERVVKALVQSTRARVQRHPPGEAIIGRARRDAVRLALDFGTERVLYSDCDHLLRWVTGNRAEVEAVLAAQPEAEMLIVGRSERAFAAEPRRLRETLGAVNRAYELLTGRAADVMFAVRRMSRATALDVVIRSRVDTLGNDVDWPLLAERLGHRIGYMQADGLCYRMAEEFAAPADSGDSDALQWIRRIEFAAEHARAMRPYLKGDRG